MLSITCRKNRKVQAFLSHSRGASLEPRCTVRLPTPISASINSILYNRRLSGFRELHLSDFYNHQFARLLIRMRIIANALVYNIYVVFCFLFNYCRLMVYWRKSKEYFV